MTTLPPLVGLIGKKRAGKDTFAAVLVEEFGFARVAFADPLKEMAYTIDPLLPADGTDRYSLCEAVEDMGWERVKDEYPEARRFLQNLGDGVRQFDPEFWVRAGMAKANALRTESTTLYAWAKNEVATLGPYPVVITDVRYPNEADAIRDAGGILVRIVRPGVDDGDTHASETALDRYDADQLVLNDTSLTDLQRDARLLATYCLD